MKNKVLVIGPQPPAIGGIATIVFWLNKYLTEIDFLDSSKPVGNVKKVAHPIVLVVRILLYCIFNYRCKILFFSSAYNSFWEKSVWAKIGRLCNADVYIVMVDGNFPEFYGNLSKRKQKLAQFIVSGTTIASQSPSWKKYYQNIFPNCKVEVVNGGVDTTFFAPNSANLETSNNPLVILFVGWIIREKGVYDMLEACSLLKERTIPFRLDLVGPIYCDKNELEQRIYSYSLEDFVNIVGPIHSREVLKERYCSSDIFLFPSHYEGFPVALLEALACGLPSIGSNVGGIPDILDNGFCGVVVNVKNPIEIAQALEHCICDGSFRNRLGVNARERAIKEYSIQASIDSYRSLLRITKD